MGVMPVNLAVPFHDMPSREWFVRALQMIGRFYRFVTLEELEAYLLRGRTFRGCCHVTFDDGDATFYRTAFPVLREMAVPATLFVSPKVVTSRVNYWFQDLATLRQRAGDTPIRSAISELFGCPR